MRRIAQNFCTWVIAGIEISPDVDRIIAFWFTCNAVLSHILASRAKKTYSASHRIMGGK